MAQDELFQPVRKIRVSDTVIDQIVSLIEEGTLQVGDSLPSERELVKQLGIARASVREALRILEYQGVIEVRQGKGTVVSGDVSSLDTDDTVRRWFREHAAEILDMLEVREALEIRAVRLATQLITPSQLAELKDVLERSQVQASAADLDPNALVQLDRKFHRLVVRASGNDILCELVDMVVDSMVSPRRSILRIPGRAARSHEDHLAILESIESGDPLRAEKAIVRHIAHVRNAIIEMRDSDHASG